MPSEGHQELYYQIALSFVPGIGAKTGRVLLEKLGSAEEIFRLSPKDLKKEGVSEVKTKGFKDPEVLARAQDELDFVIKNNVQTIYTGKGYPTRLAQCSDAPLLLFFKGNANLDAKKIVAIVGTRKNTDYGHKLTEELVEGLQGMEDVLVVSGLALGIDAIAHKKCLQAGVPTVGVLGHGLDRVYPYSHKLLAEQMLENGGILAEYPSLTLPDRNNFPMRNRIVAGMSDVTVVVESHATGGALITAQMASGYNRDVVAYPGRVSDTRSTGCNELIRRNVAGMVTKAADLIEMMNWNKEAKPKAVQRQLFLNLREDEQKIIDFLQTRDSIHSDELFHQTGLTSSALASTLLMLEMQGLVKALPGKLFRLT